MAKLSLPPEDLTALQALERLRRELEYARAEAASRGAYDDRFGGGSGLDAELQKWEKRRAELEPQLEAQVAELRQTRPAVIEQWVAIQQAFYRKLLRRYAKAHDLEEYVIQESLQAWDQVRAGRR